MNKMRKRTFRIVALVIAVIMLLGSVMLILPSSFYGSSMTVYATEQTGSSEAESSGSYLSSGYSTGSLSVDNDVDFLKELIEIIKKEYHQDVSYEELVNSGYHGILNKLDPYSVYYEGQKELEEFISAVENEFVGVGVSIDAYYGRCRVVSPVPDSPAAKAGIKAGDLIVNVDGVEYENIQNVSEIQAQLRGEEGTSTIVKIQREGVPELLTFELVRAKVKIATVEYEMLDDKIGYIKIISFSSDTISGFRKAKRALDKEYMEGLIVDIRDNSGGYLGASIDVARRLVPSGPIVHYKRQGEIVGTDSVIGTELDIPLVLLINEGSASASEILAGAVKDSKAGKLVGVTTFGKGCQQTIVNMGNGGVLKLSSTYFLSRDQHDIDHIGIAPDYVVRNYNDITTEDMNKELSQFTPMLESKESGVGETGLNIYGAQQRLNYLGYAVSVNGKLDENTASQLKKFQGANDLRVTGILDYGTIGKLNSNTINKAIGYNPDKDLQMDKALSVVKSMKVAK